MSTSVRIGTRWKGPGSNYKRQPAVDDWVVVGADGGALAVVGGALAFLGEPPEPCHYLNFNLGASRSIGRV